MYKSIIPQQDSFTFSVSFLRVVLKQCSIRITGYKKKGEDLGAKRQFRNTAMGNCRTTALRGSVDKAGQFGTEIGSNKQV